MRIPLIVLSSMLALTAVSLGQSPDKKMPDPVMIRLVDPLDEPEFYCLDIPGYGQRIQLDSALTAHTLKAFGYGDEMWVLDYPSKGQIYCPDYERCIQADQAKPGSSLWMKPPSDSPLQRFKLTEEGTIVLSENPELGFAVAPGKGAETGGPSHLARKMGLKRLAEVPDSLKKWKLVKSAESWPE